MKSKGVTLLELLAALVLASLLGALGLRLLTWQSAAFRHVVAVWEWEEASRVTFGVLERELRQGVAGRDWVAHGGDSLSLRAFRGLALPCGAPWESGNQRRSLRVVSRGMREEDPGKDSLLVLHGGGDWMAIPLLSAGNGGSAGGPGGGASAEGSADDCPPLPSGRIRIWEVGLPPGDPATFPVPEFPPLGEPEYPWVFLRYFESGQYHLTNGALRHRRGQGGRQPLTAQVLSHESAMIPTNRGVQVILVGDLPPWPAPLAPRRRVRSIWPRDVGEW